MGREGCPREGIYVYIWLIRFAVQQKIMQHCKATIFQFFLSKKKNFQWQTLTWALDYSNGRLAGSPLLVRRQ